MSKIEKALKKAYEQKKKNLNLNSSGGQNYVEYESEVEVSKDEEKDSGFIPLDRDSQDKDKVYFEELVEKQIIYPGMESREITNAFRDLRTQLLQKSHNTNFTVLITSAIEGDDSCFVAINLAAAFSLDETKTSLVVDCELASPKVHEVLGLDVEFGVLDYLTDSAVDVSSIIYQVGIERLRIIPSGSQKSRRSEYFNTAKMKSLLTDLTDRYNNRYIFVSAPAVTKSADTKILAEMCDFIILVVPYGKISDSNLQAVYDDLPREKVVGSVFNNIPNI